MPKILERFAHHQRSVGKLVNFDRDILDFVLGELEAHVQRNESAGRTNPDQNGEKLLRILRPVRSNDSLRPRYEAVFNQAVVPLVSHFSSTVHSLFTNAVRYLISQGSPDSDLAKEKLTFHRGDV